MSKNRMLILFAAAGVILALVLGVYFYRSNLGPTRGEVTTALLEDFFGKIAANDLPGARALMTNETRSLLREPGTMLGQTVYQQLKLKSVDDVFADGGLYVADVTLTGLDTLKVTTKAGMLFAEQVTESGPVDDPDQAMAEIYEEILGRQFLHDPHGNAKRETPNPRRHHTSADN